jgi:hypothetical protein
MNATTKKGLEDELQAWESGLARATPGTSVYQAIVARVEYLRERLREFTKSGRPD